MTRDEDLGGPLDCAPVREWLMDADPRELGGRGDDARSRHLEECEACGRGARRVTRGVTLLDQTLAVRAHRRSVEELLERVHGEVDSDEASKSGPTSGRATGRAARWRAVVPLAAAAVLVALALWSQSPDRRPVPGEVPTGPGGIGGAAASSFGRPLRGTGQVMGGEPELRVVADARFALMETDEPTISVVWFY